MNIYQTNQIKNTVLLGSAGSGKTTLAEAIMFEGGVIKRRGEIENKNTVSDYHEIEHEHAGSVYSTVLYTEWQNKKINIIDTPGADDFIGAVVSSLKVTDTGLMILNAQHGIEVGTEIIGRYTEKYQKPIIFVVNQCDHDNANFEKTIEQAKAQYKVGNKVAIIQYPFNTGLGFDSIIDVFKMKMYKYTADGEKPEILPIPDKEKENAEKLHNQLIESAAENDEKLMETFFEKDTLNEDEIIKGIKLGLLNRDFFPVLCISAKKNIGVSQLMEFVALVAPFVEEMPMPKTTDEKEIKCNPAANTSVFVFKTSIEPHIGEISYFKVISGNVAEGMDLINSDNNTKERFSQVFVVAGKNRFNVKKLLAGDIGATVKLKNTKTNNTLNEKKSSLCIEPITFPEPKYRIAIKAKNEADDEKLSEILYRMHEEDPTFTIEYSKELKQIIIRGQGEFHLNTAKWHLDNIHKIDIQFIEPKIPYRETITKVAQSTYRHKKQSGGAGQFGEVYMVIEPYIEGMPDPVKFKVIGKEITVKVRKKEEIDLEWGGKLVYYNCIVGGAIDERFLPAILKGIMEKMEEGPLTGSYARDIRISVYDGKMHSVDSNEISFKIAGLQAFREAFKKAGPKILEPIYDVEVIVPSDSMGDVMSDLQGRRAIIEGMSSEGQYEKLNTKVPLAEMSKYSTVLSSLTHGKATYTMKFAEYSQVSSDIQEKLLKAYEAEQEIDN